MRVAFWRTCCTWALCGAGMAQAAQFSFVALGDTAYAGEADHPAYAALIDRINRSQPAFTIHVGDVWGDAECLDKDHRDILGWFGRFDQPVVYTPGDNEWTDCIDPKVLNAFWRIGDGKAQPGDKEAVAEFRRLSSRANRSDQWALDSLARIRQLYFSTPRSLGKTTIALVRQSAQPGPFAHMVENARWSMDGVVFATVHVVGSMNGLSIASEDAAAEAVRRNQADVAWIQDAFAEAARTDAKAVVLAMHASFFEKTPAPGHDTGHSILGGRHGPYGLIAMAVQDLAESFGKPVLLIHGDSHEFMIDRPFYVSDDEAAKPKGARLTRLQVYGAPEIRAVRIGVDTDTPWVFSFSPLYND